MKYALFTPGQEEEIQNLFLKTFSDSEGAEEGKVIAELVKDFFEMTDKSELKVFTAMDGETLAGSIIFTPLRCEDGTNAWLLSPVAVHTGYQGKGIGQALINFGLNTLREAGAALAVTYGDINFYSKVGFEPISEELVKAPLKLSYPEGWLGQSLTGEAIQPVVGETRCAKALNDQAYW